jgi:uncharacterized damage-inducible protein DinB
MRELIDTYADGGDKLRMSIRGLLPEDLLAKPDKDAGVGLWSIQQVVIHLLDCDQVFADRIKRVIAEDNPSLPAFDENQWAAALNYDERSAEEATTIFDLARKQIASILRKLPDTAFERAGTHSERGRMTLTDLLNYATRHLDHHLKFIHAKRAKMGKEMW